MTMTHPTRNAVLEEVAEMLEQAAGPLCAFGFIGGAGGDKNGEEDAYVIAKILPFLAEQVRALKRDEAPDGIEADSARQLLNLLNPLHGSLDEQTYDEKRKAEFDPHPDDEYAVNVTSKQEGDLTKAVVLLEKLASQSTAQPSGERGELLNIVREFICEFWIDKPQMKWSRATCDDGLEMVAHKGDTIFFGDPNHKDPNDRRRFDLIVALANAAPDILRAIASPAPDRRMVPVEPSKLPETVVTPARCAILKLVPLGYGMTREEADSYARAAIATYLDGGATIRAAMSPAQEQK
jgi:hypothetical protein